MHESSCHPANDNPLDICRANNADGKTLKAIKAPGSIIGRTTNVKLVDPPSCSSAASTVVFIGQNSRGQWVAQEQKSLYGGLFVNRAQAIKYALFENGNHPETIVELSHKIELDMAGGVDFSSRRSVA